MEIINQSRDIAPLNLTPLERIELISKVCTKKENTITNSTATKFFKNRIHDGHCAIAEHGVEYYKIDTLNHDVYVESILNQFKYIDYVYSTNEEHIIYIAINYRILIDIYTNIYDEWKERDNYDCMPCYKLIGNIIAEGNNIHTLLFNDDQIKTIDYICANNNDNMYLLELVDEYEIIKNALEILSISVKFITDRGVSHELVRHKTASFMQESTRWCKYNKGIVFIRPWWMNDKDFNYINDNNNIINENGFSDTTKFKNDGSLEKASYSFVKQCLCTERNYNGILYDINQAQAARAVLGQNVKTEIWVTTSVAKWIGFDYASIECPIKEKKGLIPQRTAKDAHPDMQVAMKNIKEQIEDHITTYYNTKN